MNFSLLCILYTITEEAHRPIRPPPGKGNDHVSIFPRGGLLSFPLRRGPGRSCCEPVCSPGGHDMKGDDAMGREQCSRQRHSQHGRRGYGNGPRPAAPADLLMPRMDPFMHAAIEEAMLGMAEGGIPIGSVIVHQGHIIIIKYQGLHLAT